MSGVAQSFQGMSQSFRDLMLFLMQERAQNAQMRQNEGPLDEVMASSGGGPPPAPGGGRTRARGRARGGSDDAPMEVEAGGGDGPPPPPGGGSKRRQARSPSRPSLTVYGGGGGGGPPPGGPHGAIASELLQTNRAIVEGIREISRQNHERTQEALLIEQRRQAAEAARAVDDAAHREKMAVLFREGLGGVHAAMASAYAAAQRAHEQSNSTAQQFMLALQDARRRDAPAENVVVSGGQPPQPPAPPGAAPMEGVPAAPPNRGQLVPAAEPAPAVKRAAVAPRRRAGEARAQDPGGPRHRGGLGGDGGAGAARARCRPRRAPGRSTRRRSAWRRWPPPAREPRPRPWPGSPSGRSQAWTRAGSSPRSQQGRGRRRHRPRRRRPRHERRQAHDPQPPRGGQPQSGLPRHRPQARQQPADPQGISKTPAKARARTRSERREVL
jgi:hypothetical protein